VPVQPYIKTLTGTITTHLLPNPAAKDGYSEELQYLGGSRRMANGAVAIDLVQSSAKRKVSITWALLTAGEKTTVTAAFAALKTDACEFRDPDGNVFNVTRDPDNPDVKFDAVVAAGGALRWRCTMQLVEVV
jgi:hypothetical protein